MTIAYIGVPIGVGADRMGVEMAPDFFREAGCVKMMSDIAGCYDLGNVQTSIIAESIHSANPEVKFLDTVVDTATQLRDKVASVIRQGYFPLVVGGDHSLGLGSVAGAALACENVGVIWFDAHGDFNTEETTPSGNLHGMPCAALMGWCTSELNTIATTKVHPSNFYWIGARDLDEGEIEKAKKHHLHIYPTRDIRSKGMYSIINEVKKDMDEKNIKHIHLSIDIDGMDPTIVCATGTKVPGGMWNSDFYTFIDEIFKSCRVSSADFVEYNRLLDDESQTTAKWCIEALHYLALKIRNV